MNIKKTLRIYARKCAYCGYIFQKFEEKTVDHIIPSSKISKGTKLTNLLVCCKSCNHQKADKDLKDFITAKIKIHIKNYLQSLNSIIINGQNYSEEIQKVLYNIIGE